VYVDGRFEAKASYTDGIGLNNEPLLIGWDDDRFESTRRFNGLIDEVEIFNRALTATEIKAIYDAGSAGKIKPASGPVGRWSGDGNANDSVDGNHGTLAGGATFAPGMVGQAFSFDGVDDLVFIGDPPALKLEGDLTIEA